MHSYFWVGDNENYLMGLMEWEGIILHIDKLQSDKNENNLTSAYIAGILEVSLINLFIKYEYMTHVP